MDWFRANGWQVGPPDSPFGPFGDFIAKKSGEAVLVEVKVRSRLSAADIRRALEAAATVRGIDRAPTCKFAIVVPAGTLSEAAKQVALRESRVSVEIIEIPEEQMGDHS